MMKLKSIGVMSALSGALLLTGCGSESGQQTSGETSVGEAVDYTITGIEPGAGLTELTRNALEEYDSLEGWELQESSTAGMLVELEQAINNEEPILITAWTPHWMFQAYDLKMLEDPEGALGEGENVQTLAREGLEEDMPNAYNILDAFQWEIEDIESVMLDAQDVSFEEAAQNWVDENQDLVAEWTEGAEQGNGESIELVSTPWDSERASASVVQLVLEQQGYDVTVTDVDPAVMFQALASGEADATVAPWLPITHGSFYEANEENLVDLGPNLTGARNALAVPAYVDIDSIEDLEPAE